MNERITFGGAVDMVQGVYESLGVDAMSSDVEAEVIAVGGTYGGEFMVMESELVELVGKIVLAHSHPETFSFN